MATKGDKQENWPHVGYWEERQGRAASSYRNSPTVGIQDDRCVAMVVESGDCARVRMHSGSHSYRERTRIRDIQDGRHGTFRIHRQGATSP